MKTDVNVIVKSNKQTSLKKNLFFVGILKATGEKSRIRIHSRIPIHNTAAEIKHLDESSENPRLKIERMNFLGDIWSFIYK
jgi:hypothetical protein